jgi:hypothetical protein
LVAWTISGRLRVRASSPTAFTAAAISDISRPGSGMNQTFTAAVPWLAR